MEPIILNADESMLLLITKNWEHKDVPMHLNESKEHYIQRVCNYRCFGEDGYKADVWACYANLAEKLLTTRQFIRVIEKANELTFISQMHPMTIMEALYSELQFTKVQDGDTKLIVLDYSEVKTEGREHLMYRQDELVAIRRYEAGDPPGFSTGICESLTCGYGELSDYGYWEFPLPYRYWKANLYACEV